MKPEHAVLLDRTLGRVIYPLHEWVYRVTDGRIGQRSALGPILLLTTTGRRSGQPRTTPLLYMIDGDRYVVVASNGGRDRAPSWLHNLEADPHAEVRAGRTRVPVTATVVIRAEDPRLWNRLDAFYAGWSHYQTLTDRDIPALVLTPAPERAQT